MEYGHVGHHRHHNHRHDNNDDDHNNTNYPPPHLSHPHPPSYGGSYNPSYPPPPPHGGAYDQPQHYGGAYNSPPPPHGGGYNPSYPPPPPHGGGYDSSYPPPPSHGGAYDPSYPPPPSHGGGYGSSYHPPRSNDDEYEGGGGSPTRHHRFQPHVPGFIGTHFHHGGDDHSSSTHSYDEMGSIENKPSYMFVSRAGGHRYAVGIRDDKLVLTHPDTSDLTQHWCKDERYSTKIKDKDGYPSFILINKGTGQAVKHSVSCHPVQLGPYEPGVLDESVLWTESKDMGSGFRTIRTVNNIHLVMDAWNADKEHGGIHDGTLIALYETWKGDNHNQQWKLIRH